MRVSAFTFCVASMMATRSALGFVIRNANVARSSRARFGLALGVGGLTATLASGAAMDSANPLLNQRGLPKFQSIAAKDVKPAMTKVLEDLQAGFEAAEESMRACAAKDASVEELYEAAVEDLERISSPVSYAWGVVGHLMGVKNSDELRESHAAMQPEVVQRMQALSQSRPLFDALVAIRDSKDYEKLSEPRRRIVEASIRSMEQSGIGLPAEERERFNKLQLEASELSTKFSNNVLDSTKAFSLKIEDKARIEGLPDSARALAAQQSGEGATPEDGPWTLTLDMPCYLPAMQHLKDRELREQLYRAFVARASAGETDNAGNILRILQLRREMCDMLGYDNYAELSISKKMAPSVQAVVDLAEQLREKALPAAEREYEELSAFAKESDGLEELNLWDIPYYSERLREERYSYTEEELRPYFSLEKVQEGLFGLAERIFGVRIVQADGEAEIWNEDVSFWKVLDVDSGEHIASFFLDPYSRPAEKRGGAWMDVCVGKSEVLGRIPVAYLTCNGSPPVGDKPSLMTFRDVETLFHETGHGLQHMLTEVREADAAGISNVEWDAVELPSQFMENWCYDEKTLYGFAKHYETGEPMPKELYEKLCASKNFMGGSMLMRQLYFGQMDIALHHTFDPTGKAVEDVFKVQKEVASRYQLPQLQPLPNDRFLCAFGHIFAGGYAAGYYSYIWAEVLSADAFGAFEDVGLENEDKVRETGRRFRETVLGMGGGKHPSEVFKLFRGRDPTPDALLRHRGLD